MTSIILRERFWNRKSLRSKVSAFKASKGIKPRRDESYCNLLQFHTIGHLEFPLRTRIGRKGKRGKSVHGKIRNAAAVRGHLVAKVSKRGDMLIPPFITIN